MNPDDIKQMTMEEYAKYRTRLLSMASHSQGLPQINTQMHMSLPPIVADLSPKPDLLRRAAKRVVTSFEEARLRGDVIYMEHAVEELEAILHDEGMA